MVMLTPPPKKNEGERRQGLVLGTIKKQCCSRSMQSVAKKIKDKMQQEEGGSY